MSDFHESVLLDEVCGALAPALVAERAGVFVDATCGGGGHTAALLERTSATRAIAVDRDEAALAAARARLESNASAVTFIHSRFSRIAETLATIGISQVDAVLADLGVSSHQLDTAERGFSFRQDAPLDMRMDPSQGPSAADLLEELDVAGLASLLRDLAEESDAHRIAQAIIHARPRSTRALADVVEASMSARQRRALGTRIHPATRTFQALRIAVNAEFDELDALLDAAPNLLNVGGRLGIITFHSLEDVRVKRRFRALTRVESPPTKLPIPQAELPRAPFSIPRGYAKGVTASAEEIRSNPRARSAKLRVLERTAVEASP